MKKDCHVALSGLLAMTRILFLFFLAFLPSFYAGAGEPLSSNLLLNGGFEEIGAGNLPEGWRCTGAVQKAISSAIGQNALSLSAGPKIQKSFATQRIILQKNSNSILTLSALIKTPNKRGGVQMEAYIGVQFLKTTGEPAGDLKKLGKWYKPQEWTPWTGIIRIPAEATQMDFVIGLEGMQGELDVDETELVQGLPEDIEKENFIVDGGFERNSPFSAWDFGKKHRVVYTPLKDSGRGALEIAHSKPVFSQTTQDFYLDDASGKRKAKLSLIAKWEKIQTNNKKGGLKINLDFLDGSGRRLKRQLVFGPLLDSSDWKQMESEIKIPSGAVQGTLRIVLDHAKGKAWLDNVDFEIPKKEGGLAAREVEFKNDTAHWQPFKNIPGSLTGALDTSSLLDGPAGRHGFLKIKDGHFVFHDGTPIRFWGINIQGEKALPSHEEAEKIAERFAQHGFNIARLHHLDSPWEKPNIFDPAFNDTGHFSAASLDRLDYFISKLKEKGIYIYLDLLVSRKFKAGDKVQSYQGLDKGAKGVAEFDPTIIALQKEYAKQLLTHENPYTKTRYVDEPALCLIDIINESSLFNVREWIYKIPFFYRSEFEKLWVEYLAEKGKKSKDNNGYLQSDEPLVQEFYAKLQTHYFREMLDFLRNTGLKVPVAGSNLVVDDNDLTTNAELDFIDRHAYWDHPRGGYGDLVKIQNKNLLGVVQQHNPIVKLSRNRVQGKPFVVGEWNIAWPNEFRAAGPLLMAAYALFQDWDGVIQFNYEEILQPEKIEGNFDVSTKPEIFLQFPAAARLFHRADVKKAVEKKSILMNEKKKIPPRLTLRHGIERVFGREASKVRDEDEGPFESDTKELVWNEDQKWVLIQTPKTQAAMGSFESSAIKLPNFHVSATNPFVCVALTSLDGHPVEQSADILVTAVARSENSGMVYNRSRGILRNSGTSPILMERVQGKLSFPLKGKKHFRIFTLNNQGQRTQIPISTAKDWVEVSLEKAHLFEIVFYEK